MTLVEHIEELRRRLVFCVAAVAIGTAFAFHDSILGGAFTVLFFVSTCLIRLLGPVSTVPAIQIPPRGVVARAGGAAERLS